MKIIESITETFADYDGYVLDLWGVVHDGRTPYPGAVAALRAMKAAGKRDPAAVRGDRGRGAK